MTRETKIGLLVGLAFIIVIGILLSDHFTGQTDPMPASLAQAGANVRDGIAVPGIEPPVTAENAGPQQKILTQKELNPTSPSGVVVVQVGGPTAGTENNATARNLAASIPSNPAGNGGLAVNGNAGQVNGDRASTSTLAAIARANGQEIVPANDRGQQKAGHDELAVALDGHTAVIPAASGNLSGGREYTAVPGDNLSRMAAKLPGGNTKANRQAIRKLNPSLAANPDVVIAGKRYLMPTSGDAAAIQPAEQTASVAVPAVAAHSPSMQPVYLYTVKAGDSLTRIANEQLGNSKPATVQRIRDLNHLKDDLIQIDMKLRLPARPIASAE